jgi:lipopolysaccharide export system protein LptA
MHSVKSQVEVDTTESDKIEVLHWDRAVSSFDGESETDSLIGNVAMRHDSTLFFCDLAIIKGKQFFAAGNVVISDKDSLNIFSEKLYYNGFTKTARLSQDVIFDNGDKKLYSDTVNYQLEPGIASYQDGAWLVRDSSKLYSNKGYYFVKDELAIFSDSVFVLDSAMTMRTDSLQYDLDSNMVFFVAPTKIIRDGTVTYCESGYYDMQNNKALLKGNPQYVAENTVATAITIFIDQNGETIELQGNANYQSDDIFSNADTIKYNESTEMAILIGDAYVKNKETVASGDYLEYNMKTGDVLSKGRTEIRDSSQIISADILAYTEVTDLGYAYGDVVWRDTVQGNSLVSDSVIFRKNTDYLKAFGGRPVFSTESSEDTLHISSDTLIQYQKIGNTPHITISYDTISVGDSLIKMQINEIADTTWSIDTAKITLAYHDVRLFKSDMQGMADSLNFNEQDSIFTLCGNPVMWMDSTQFSADTIFMYLKNKLLSSIVLVNEALVLSTTDELLFDQLKGRRIVASFKEGKLATVKVDGNAQTIYYLKDDNNVYSGVNVLNSSRIILAFEDNNLISVKYYNQPTGNFLPMVGTDHTGIQLDGFNWRFPRRPLSMKDLREVIQTEEKEDITENESEENPDINSDEKTNPELKDAENPKEIKDSQAEKPKGRIKKPGSGRSKEKSDE